MKTPIPYDDHEDYHQALGVFVDLYAKAEITCLIFFWTSTGMRSEVAQALWPSLRLGSTIGNIRKVYSAKKTELPEQLGEALSQLATIHSIRDDVLHYGSVPGESGRMVTTKGFIFNPDKVTERRVSAPMLHCLATDLGTIICRLIVHTGPPPDPAHLVQYEQARKSAQAPLLYKPPQPGKKGQKKNDSR